MKLPDVFEVKDSGERKEFESGMVRDAENDKVDYTYVIPGPMLDRWANHLTKGAVKYDRDNWLLGEGDEEYHRARRSAARHMIQWLRGETDEDHAAAVFFNLNAAEYFLERMNSEKEPYQVTQARQRWSRSVLHWDEDK